MATQLNTVRPVRANVGQKIRYRNKMLSLIKEMSDSVEYWLEAEYKKNPPVIAELVAQDAIPSREMNKKIRELSKRWQKRFDELAPKIAELYLKGSFAASNSAFQSALKDAGFAVKFELTPAMRDAFEASLAENVSLIKSIPAEYFGKIEGIVNRGYAAGRDLSQITKGIQKLYPSTSKRAVLIARDQSNKANAVVIRMRQMELGITEAIWTHSAGGKTPRTSHVAANGKTFSVTDGMLIDGALIFPGELINCRCVSRAVLPKVI